MKHALAIVLAGLWAAQALALPRDPAVSATEVAFVEAGQVWIVARTSTPGTPRVARRVTDTPGAKLTPRFSPDGATLAFAANEAQGELNLFTIPVSGGEPTRVTFLPGHQVLCQWTADGRLLFYASALSFSAIEMQLYTVPAAGGLPVRLPPAYGSDGALDATGTRLAYTPEWPNPLMESWKRYRGGAAPDLWLLDLGTGESEKVTTWPGADLRPMWHGEMLYYLSDEGEEERRNLWAYDPRSGARRQITHFDQDVRNPSIGPDAIVFELAAGIRILDLGDGTISALDYTLPAGQLPALEREVDAGRFITHRALAAGGRRVLYEARGDLWVADQGGPPRNLTATSGAFEREASLSPDGRSVAYWSDAGGEYQLYVRDLDGGAPPPPLTPPATGFRRRPVWSPDQERLAFADLDGGVFVFELAGRELRRIDAAPGIEPVELAWSPDSRWLAYTNERSDRFTSIWRHDVTTGECRQLTSPVFSSSTPVFAPGGERLFFVSYRDLSHPVWDWLQQRIAHRGTAVVMAVPLAGAAFDAESIERRAMRLGTTPGTITALGATHDGRAVYGLLDFAGAASVRSYDPVAGEEVVLVEGTSDFALSADGRHLLVEREGQRVVLEIGGAGERPASEDGMTVRVDLRAEWRQIFDDTWRYFRDFFYAPKAPAPDWQEVRRRYAPMLAAAFSRVDVNYVLSEMIGESSVGHAYLGAPGDVPAPPAGTVAMPGADFELVDGRYRIAAVPEGAPWDDTARSPLREARAGEYLLAVDGVAVDATKDPRAAFLGLVGKEATVTVAADPAGRAARDLRVTPIGRENDLRRRAWIERNRQGVASASGGRIGYVHIPNFSRDGFGDLARQLYGQDDRDALVIDARWSLGGSIGLQIAELLDRRPLTFPTSRSVDGAWPDGSHYGPKALLVNHITVSNGENFATYFRKLGLGPVVGSRTWGGLTGLNPVPPLIDGGGVNVPNVPFFDETGYLVEGHGVEPDVEVERDPASAEDAQLLAAVRLLLEAIAETPYDPPPKPPG